MFKCFQKPAIFAFFLFFLANCSNDPSSNSGQVSTGQWKVVYFFDDKDETADFSGFTFDFKSDGSLTAQKDGQSWSGTWSDNCDDSANKLCIGFNSGHSALDELSEDWRIIEIKSDFMHLEHTSGGNGDTDIVHFEKL